MMSLKGLLNTGSVNLRLVRQGAGSNKMHSSSGVGQTLNYRGADAPDAHENNNNGAGYGISGQSKRNYHQK